MTLKAESTPIIKRAAITDEDVKTYEKNTKAYKANPNHVQELITKTRERHNPLCQVNAKLRHDDKTALYVLIKNKGCDGLTSFLKMLAKAKEVSITI